MLQSLWNVGERLLVQAQVRLNPCIETRRWKGFRHPGGKKFPGGIRYYPRFPKEKDPVIEPSKLFRVERIQPIKGTTRIQRRILELFHLATIGETVTIVKNIPEHNASLWKIKHLVKITPITFPHGEPTADDMNNTILKENGECIVRKQLEIPKERIEAWNKFKNNPAKIEGGTIVKQSRLIWQSGWSGGF